MDRKNRRVTYLTGANATFNAYGMNDDQKKKKNKKKNAIQSRIRMAILIFALIGVLIVCVIYALTGSTREGVGRVTRIGATRSQNVFVGEADNGVVSVINSSGQIVDNITVSNQTLLDIGFFMASTANNTQPTELMWMLGLNTTGTVLSTELQTFQPGKLSTGKSSIGEHIAYSIYDDNGTLNVVTTRQILHYSYRALEASSPTLIYGYTVEDVSRSGNTVYQLLVPAQEQSEGISIANVRLVYGGIDRVIHLPSACIAAKLGTKSVYGFSQNAVYACSFGDTTFRTYALPINVTAVLGMMNDNRAVVASGSEIYVVELPT